MGFWSKAGKFLGMAAPFIAAPFTGGLSLIPSLAMGAGIGAAGGALSGGGLKGTLLGAGMGAAAPGFGAMAGKAGAAGIAGKIGQAATGGGGGGNSMWGPIAATGIGTAMTALGSRKTSGEKGMEQMMGQYSGLSNMIGKYAQGQHTMAQPAIQKAMQYYTQLASGNRGQIGSAIAPDLAAMNETYKGAQSSIQNNTTGATREASLAKMAQQKAGQAGLMPMQARQNAIGQLGNMGMELNNNVLGAYGQMGSNLYGMSSAYGQMANMQNQRNQGWSQLGQNLGNIWLPMLLGNRGGGTQPNPYGIPGGMSMPMPKPKGY